MGCFCKSAMGPLQNAQQALTGPAGEAASDSPAGAEQVGALAAWLAARGLPAAPWQPDPDWQEAPLPRLAMGAQAMLTISAIANLRAQALAQFGLDLQDPAQARMFARLAATLGARMAAAPPAGTGQAWQRLGALNAAIDQVGAAVQSGVFTAGADAYALAPEWRPFLSAVRSLLPLIAVAVQLGLDMRANFAPDLAAAVRSMLAARLPPLPPAQLAAMAGLSAQLTAVSSLAASLGVDPLQAGYKPVQQMVARRLAALRPALPPAGELPAMPYCPTVPVTPAVVQLAQTMNAEAVAALTWQAPAMTSVPLLQVGLPVAGLAAQLKTALGISPAAGPCAGCDANAVLQAALAA